MADLGIAAYAAMAIFCLVAAFLVLWALSRIERPKAPRQGHGRDAIAFVVDNDDIVEASAQGEIILSEVGRDSPRKWLLLHVAFRTRFPSLPRNVEEARAMAPARIAAADSADPACLVLEPLRGGLRLGLEDPTESTLADRHLHLRHFAQIAITESVVDVFPYPVWMRSARGRLYWANKAYYALLGRVRNSPDEAELDEFEFALKDGEDSHSERRLVQDRESGQSHWFSVTKSGTSEGNLLGFALDIDPVIDAEIAQRKFVQTLTKTFAQLSTGLAIFDRERQLALFNPSLIDLLALPADFLSSRPTLLTFFDRLRDNRMMPEPKNYANWRHQITDLVIASVDGRYQETWTMPSGLTYRVTGRPHPDGAIALLFEDISAEVSLTQRFRSQLNLGQAVINTLDEAIAVFAPNGSLTMSNLAFRRLWKLDPDSSFAEVTFRDALSQWQGLTRPGPFWTRLQAYLADKQDRSEWFSDVRMKNGTQMECRVTPISGGATLVGFRMRPVLEAAANAADHDQA